MKELGELPGQQLDTLEGLHLPCVNKLVLSSQTAGTKKVKKKTGEPLWFTGLTVAGSWSLTCFRYGNHLSSPHILVCSNKLDRYAI